MQLRKQERPRNKSICAVWLTAALLTGCLSSGCHNKAVLTSQAQPLTRATEPVPAAEIGADPSRLTREPASAAVHAALGSIVYVDPATGQFGEPPPEVLANLLGSESSFSTSGEGLAVTWSPVLGGGKMIDLQGRFQNAMTATISPAGTPTTDCVNAAVTPSAATGGGAAKPNAKP